MSVNYMVNLYNIFSLHWYNYTSKYPGEINLIISSIMRSSLSLQNNSKKSSFILRTVK